MVDLSAGNLWRTATNGVLIAVGSISAVLGVIGMALPLVPGIPFLILAGICFAAVK